MKKTAKLKLLNFEVWWKLSIVGGLNVAVVNLLLELISRIVERKSIKQQAANKPPLQSKTGSKQTNKLLIN